MIHLLLKKVVSEASFSISSNNSQAGYPLASTSYNQMLYGVHVSVEWITIVLHKPALTEVRLTVIFHASLTRGSVACDHDTHRAQWLTLFL